MAYIKQTWVDGQAGGTPISAARLNHVEDGIGTLESDTQTSLNAKANLASPTFTGNPVAPTPATADNDTSVATTAFVQANMALKANLASPAFTGNPSAPTPATADNDTSVATTAFVQANIANQIPKSLVTAKGDLIGASADGTPAKLSVGVDGQFLQASSGNSLGMKWTDTAANQFQIVRAAPEMLLTRNQNAPVDNQRWLQAIQTSDGRVSFATYTDAGAFIGNRFEIYRSGGVAIDGIKNLSGVGFPEGVVTAPTGSTYIDTAATNGAVRWVKAAGAGNTGWQVEYGNTGWRDISSALTATWIKNPSGGFCRISRVGKRVDLQCRLAPTGAAIGSTRVSSIPSILTIPADFVPNWNGHMGSAWSLFAQQFPRVLNNLGTGTSTFAVSSVDGDAGTWASGETLVMAGTWYTETIWPTVLPGTPA